MMELLTRKRIDKGPDMSLKSRERTDRPQRGGRKSSLTACLHAGNADRRSYTDAPSSIVAAPDLNGDDHRNKGPPFGQHWDMPLSRDGAAMCASIDRARNEICMQARLQIPHSRTAARHLEPSPENMADKAGRVV